ncbi:MULTISPECIES: hypothetical protein [Francisella]|uniref:hypothetical protein n=1 Tax=Francisella TaxID=262 RepID=UPI0011B4B427|nr:MULTISPECIES: hypothetical protein [Francisella]
MKIEENELNTQILKVWKENCPVKVTRMPLLYPKLKKQCLLFIGINPSYSTKGFRSLLPSLNNPEIKPDNFFKFPNMGNFSTQISLEIESIARNHYPYFKKFEKLSEKLKLEWEHIDLFQLRETNQKLVKEILLKKDNEPNEFANQQLKIALELIEQAKPKAIIVANALASNIFENKFPLDYNKILGCHIMSIRGVKTPVFLASMLTGQRAMDNYSFQRLTWHINHVLNKWK